MLNQDLTPAPESPYTESYPSARTDCQIRLAHKISSLLRETLGATPVWRGESLSWPGRNIRSPSIHGMQACLIYFVFFCGAPYLSGQFFFEKFHPILLWLSLWGACYLGFAVIIARLTSQSVEKTITDSIIPKLDDIMRAAIGINPLSIGRQCCVTSTD